MLNNEMTATIPGALNGAGLSSAMTQAVAEPSKAGPFNSMFVLHEGTTVDELEQHVIHEREKSHTPEGNWIAAVTNVTLTPDDGGQVIVLFDVHARNEDGTSKVYKHREVFFVRPKKNFSKSGPLLEFFKAFDIKTITTKELQQIVGRFVNVAVTHSKDKKYANLTKFAMYEEALSD